MADISVVTQLFIHERSGSGGRGRGSSERVAVAIAIGSLAEVGWEYNPLNGLGDGGFIGIVKGVGSLL